MATGLLYTVKIHENSSGTVVLDSISIAEFTHADGFTLGTSVTKEDFVGTPHDAFVVGLAYPSGSTPNQGTKTLTAVMNDAKNAVNAAYGNGEAGAPS